MINRTGRVHSWIGPMSPAPLILHIPKVGTYDVSEILSLVRTDLSELICGGGYGYIYKGIYRRSGREVAVKIILFEAWGDDGRQCVQNEIDMHTRAYRIPEEDDVHDLVLPIIDHCMGKDYGCKSVSSRQLLSLEAHLLQV